MCRCLGVNLLQWNVLLEASKTSKVNLRHPNILPLLCIWVKCAGVWGNIFPKKWDVFIKLYPMSKAHMSLFQNFNPDLQKIYTDISAASVTLWNSVDNEDNLDNEWPFNQEWHGGSIRISCNVFHSSSSSLIYQRTGENPDREWNEHGR